VGQEAENSCSGLIAPKSVQPVSMGRRSLIVFGGSVMQIGLLTGLLLMLGRRRRIQKPYPFLIGFEVVGWIAHLIYVALCLQAAPSLDRHLRAVITPLLNSTGFPPLSKSDLICRYVLGIVCLTAPQLAIALIGGWISQIWSKRTHPGQVPSPV
jgi:hypothetical protein